MKNLRAALTLLLNTSEKSRPLCEQCVDRRVVHLLLEELASAQFHAAEAMRDQNRMYLVKGYLGILVNIMRFQFKHARELFRRAGAVDVLQQYLQSSLLMVKTRSLVLLSFLVDERQNDVIHANDRFLALLIKMLQACLTDTNHVSRKYGFSAAEVATGGFANLYSSLSSHRCSVVE